MIIKPIKTAPKDGTAILLIEGDDIFKATWDVGGHWMIYCGQPVVYGVEPTHWMDIPSENAERDNGEPKRIH